MPSISQFAAARNIKNLLTGTDVELNIVPIDRQLHASHVVRRICVVHNEESEYGGHPYDTTNPMIMESFHKCSPQNCSNRCKSEIIAAVIQVRPFESTVHLPRS